MILELPVKAGLLMEPVGKRFTWSALGAQPRRVSIRQVFGSVPIIWEGNDGIVDKA
jgi:hypothetical protein